MNVIARLIEQAAAKAKGPRVTGAGDLVDLDMVLHNDNAAKKAIAVSFDAATPFEKWVWLPRSQMQYEITGHKKARVTMPEGYAVEKGLL